MSFFFNQKNADTTKVIFETIMNDLPKVWDAKEAILFMKNNGSRNWKQMEWQGWYFEFMCETILRKNSFFEIPGKKYGNVSFDGFNEINYDFKAHSEFKGSTPKVPTNGYLEVEQAIADYGKVCFIVACGSVEFDDDEQTFKKWHDNLKGKKSKYVLAGEKSGRRSRRRKTKFNLNKIIFLYVDKSTLPFVGSFQKGMINSDGTPRNSKVMIDLEDTRFEKYAYEV
ncbi:MAG: hypothetical protein BWX74_00123 [Tenericutes bacterium ADurb.Bin087]|jgi:hypothetical protein|nr:MAG: hypothetical protein BWX74_00123 [Tenericutes bacterium ADurb.Bin087]